VTGGVEREQRTAAVGARRVALEQMVVLERGKQARRCRAGQAGVLEQCGEADRLVGLDDERQQLRGAVDSLRAGVGHGANALILWNSTPTL
jgi:hypothetical protein